MPGNSRVPSKRKTSKKGAVAGSGGKNRQSLAGRGRTLPADERPWHKGYSGDERLPEKTARKQRKEIEVAKKEGRAPKVGAPGTKSWNKATGKTTVRTSSGGAKRTSGSSRPRVVPTRTSHPPKDSPELLVGRNPVVEALRAAIPVTALYIAVGIEADERIAEALRTASNRNIALMEISRHELDRMTGGVLHQGIAIQVPPYAYQPFPDLLRATVEQASPLLVALDGVTDPRNLGAIVRSAVAFGAHGVLVPNRRAAGMTATAWRTSAGAAARVPIAQVTNLTRTIKTCQEEGFLTIGLDADGETELYDVEAAVDPVLLVVGSEGRGLSRLVSETCDMRVSIPMTSRMESLNASVAAAIALAEIARRRRL